MQRFFNVSLESTIQHLNGFEVMVSNSTDRPGMNVFTGDVNDLRAYYTVYIPDIMARFITIQRTGVLTICEIAVIEGGIKNKCSNVTIRKLFTL